MQKGISKWALLRLAGKFLFVLPPGLLFNSLRIAFLAKQRGLPLRTFITIAAVRTFLTTFTPAEIQTLVPSTNATFQAWAAQQTPLSSRKPSTSLLENGRLHWLNGEPDGANSNSKVLLFFHGGGYAVPLGSDHLKWCQRHVETARASGIDLHVAVLEYDLCPGTCYPRQLQQAAFALGYILDLGVKPGNIVIGGDSAGGNLTLALLCHLLHPHPAVREIKLPAPLAGAFAISPWITMDMSTRSFRENKHIDMLSPSLVRQSGTDFLRDAAASSVGELQPPWSLALSAPAEWWAALHTCVGNLYLNAGKHEMFRDHVVWFARHLGEVTERRNVAITVDIGEKETHDHVLTEFMMHREGGRAFGSLSAWMLDTLKRYVNA